MRYFDSMPGFEEGQLAPPSHGDSSVIPVVFANGLGGPASAWIPYLRALGSRYRLMSWDYRGLYGSLLARRNTRLDVAAHAEDLQCVLNSAGVERVHFVGWSMGVQVGLELFTREPSRVASLSLLNGTYGRPLRGVPIPFAELTLGPIIPRARILGRIGSRVLSSIGRSPMSYRAIRALKIAAPGLDREHFYRMIQDFQHVDLDVYFELLDELGAHNAEAILPCVDVPTLVVTGSKDVLTPPHLARRMAQMIRKAELFVIPEGTHYAPAEYPQVVAERLDSFWQGHFASCNSLPIKGSPT